MHTTSLIFSLLSKSYCIFFAGAHAHDKLNFSRAFQIILQPYFLAGAQANDKLNVFCAFQIILHLIFCSCAAHDKLNFWHTFQITLIAIKSNWTHQYVPPKYSSAIYSFKEMDSHSLKIQKLFDKNIDKFCRQKIGWKFVKSTCGSSIYSLHIPPDAASSATRQIIFPKKETISASLFRTKIFIQVNWGFNLQWFFAFSYYIEETSSQAPRCTTLKAEKLTK